MRLTSLLFLFVFAVSSPAFAKDEGSSLESAVKGAFGRDNDSDKGKPDNPGEHGRENAAEKQSRDHGAGGKNEDSWEDKIRDEFKDDSSKDKGKDKGKDKNKNKKD